MPPSMVFTPPTSFLGKTQIIEDCGLMTFFFVPAAVEYGFGVPQHHHTSRRYQSLPEHNYNPRQQHHSQTSRHGGDHDQLQRLRMFSIKNGKLLRFPDQSAWKSHRSSYDNQSPVARYTIHTYVKETMYLSGWEDSCAFYLL